MSKRVSDSRTQQVQVLTPANLNGANRLFGSQLLQWIDIVATVAARRHCGKDVTTAGIDSLEFRGPARENDTLVLDGRVVYAGRTSMEVRVDTYVESLNGERKLINTASLIMVALDENENPALVPELIPETDIEREEWEKASRKRAERKRQRLEDKNETRY